jgi:HD-GYP domain-containing protein (c-di-GMP phosphodiesterase class II)
MAKEHRKTVSIGELKIGSEASTSYYDGNGVLLIAQGVLITATLVEKLRRHGVETLHVGVAPRSKSERDGRSEIEGEERQPPRTKPRRRPTPPPSSTDEARDPADAAKPTDQSPGRDGSSDLQPALRSYPPEKIARLGRLQSMSVATVERLIDTVTGNQVASLQETDPVVEGYIQELVEDADPVIASTLAYEANLDLAKRCVQLSTLSMAVALRTDVAAGALREVGRAALVHDWGLFELPSDRRFPHQKMDEPMRRDYEQHPIIAEAMMHSLRGSTFTVAVLVAQVHELMNGTGFPRRLSGDAIHPLARILSVADAYLTLTSPPRGHPRIVPCDAIAFLLNGVSKGQYAPAAVTGLLEAVTLYPLGSVIELSDASKARVVRTNGTDYGYPIVELLSEPGSLIDLKQSELFVTRPVPSPEANEVRLPETYTDLASSLPGRYHGGDET